MNDVGLLETRALGPLETESSADWKHIETATRRKSAPAWLLNHANRRISQSSLTARLLRRAAYAGCASPTSPLDDPVSAVAHRRASLVRTGSVQMGPLARSAKLGEPADNGVLTRVALRWVAGRIEDRLIFGLPLTEILADRRTRILGFPSGQCVAVVRSTMNRRGISISRLDIFMTVKPGDAYTTIPLVRPGGDLLLTVRGWSKISTVLDAVTAIEKIGIDPGDAAPDHWRHVHNRLAADLPPRTYSPDRHAAFVARSALMGASS
jgi:hypothetical protein